MNQDLAQKALKKIIECGVSEFCLCPGKRNAPLVALLSRCEKVKKYYWFEERSAAFFALGRSRSTGHPVAVVTTSGTAAGELLPATMEAYYTGVPLLLITADRPRHFRGTGAPQTAEQIGLFGRYVIFEEDLALDEESSLELWHLDGPAHINICFDEPLQISLDAAIPHCSKYGTKGKFYPRLTQSHSLQNFLKRIHTPLVVVGQLHSDEREAVVRFLCHLNAPCFLEGISGLRQDSRLAHLRIARTDKLWEAAAAARYPIDGILRIGGVPTFRLWRDLEDQPGKLEILVISSLPFTGLSWGELLYTPLKRFFESLNYNNIKSFDNSAQWLLEDRKFSLNLTELLHRESRAESSLIYSLSKLIPRASMVYLGNSLPIREWDLAAAPEDRDHHLYASRGVNGIDGQISTFLGLSCQDRENWAVIGDLTALYDMAGPWILTQLPGHHVTIVIVNNFGGQIFSRMFKEKVFLHEHKLEFAPLAAMWGMEYQQWESIPERMEGNGMRRLIELIPDSKSTDRFWHALGDI